MAFREAIACSAAHLILVHNHPSGDPKPSPDDIRTTHELVQAGRIVGIPILDHVIVGRSSKTNPSGFISLKESGLLG
jgi:DNA repair protein RadC